MEYKKQHLLTALRVIIFFACVGLVIHGQQKVSYGRLAEMGAGIVGMLAVIWDYNRRNR